MGKRFPSWGEIRRRTRELPWAKAVLDAVRSDFDRWQGLVVPGPLRESAWTHHYFCDDDGSPLRFDEERHVCTSCSRVYTGEPWDGAWRTRTHNAAAEQAQRAALLARLSDGPFAVELERIVSAYARDYTAYAPHGANAGRGRVQPQSLDEAVWAVGLLRAVRWGTPLTPATSDGVDRMARAIADLLRPQVGQVHNIDCWLLAALAECGARLGDAELLEWCQHGEFGAEAQIRDGLRAEGLWYEVNPHYHYYAVAALLSYREAGGGLSPAAARHLARAVNAPPALAYDDGRLPAYGDGWPDCFLSDFAPQAEAACALLPEAPIDVGAYYASPRPGPVRLWFGTPVDPGEPATLTGRSSVAALVFGPDTPARVEGVSGSFVWPDAGIGVLRSSRVRLAMRFGPDAGWHDHRDKLNVDVGTAAGWHSLDLGTSGYGADFTAWLRSPLAHNLVIADGLRQPPHTGKLLDWAPDSMSAESSWEGRRFRRTLTLTGDGWQDVHHCFLPDPVTVEWVFHGDGPFLGDDGFQPEPDWARLSDVRRLSLGWDRVLRGAWSHPGGPRLSLPVPEGFTAYTAVAPGNPTGHPLGLVVLRGTAREAVFRADFTLP